MLIICDHFPYLTIYLPSSDISKFKSKVVFKFMFYSEDLHVGQLVWMTLRITETEMRFKIFIVTFLPFSLALQWTFHEDKALDVTPGSSTTISTFSTLEEAKNECLDNPECGGITHHQGNYQLRKGTVLTSWATSTTYMKSFVQWIEHPGKVLSGSSLGSFDDLVQAKNKCIDRLNNSFFPCMTFTGLWLIFYET